MKASFLVLLVLVCHAFGQQPVPAKPAEAAVPATPGVFTSVEQIGAGMPRLELNMTGDAYRLIGQKQANVFLSEQAEAQKGKLRFTVEQIYVNNNAGEKWAFRMKAEDVRVTLNGTTIPRRITVYLKADQAAAIGKLKPGSVVTASGVFTRAEIITDELFPLLVLDMREGKLEP